MHRCKNAFPYLAALSIALALPACVLDAPDDTTLLDEDEAALGQADDVAVRPAAVRASS